MKIYIAAQYRMKRDVCEYALILRDAGHEVVSSWHLEPHDGGAQLGEIPENLLREYAERDLGEIRQSEVMLFFSVSDQTMTQRGGRHVEFGYALAHDKRIIVIGPRENMFHYFPDIEITPNLRTAIEALK